LGEARGATPFHRFGSLRKRRDTVRKRQKTKPKKGRRALSKVAGGNRIDQIRKQIEETNSDYDREKLQERLAHSHR
jgi:hypothetical protein